MYYTNYEYFVFECKKKWWRASARHHTQKIPFNEIREQFFC